EARARVVQDRGAVLDVQTSNRQPAFLVLGDLYSPGWTVSINGQPGRILQTNYIQRGVVLPAGQNFVHFAFRPPRFYAGLCVSGAGVLLCILAAFVARTRGVL
ncbi:MAG TPA: YfhO family protein, partial [Bryobacteraceae bacterium]|nr:YfhO family protein [Bryobacteraceae bacterium]